MLAGSLSSFTGTINQTEPLLTVAILGGPVVPEIKVPFIFPIDKIVLMTLELHFLSPHTVSLPLMMSLALSPLKTY